MPSDQPGIDGQSAAINGRSPPNYRSSTTRSPTGRLDGRSAAGKRVRDLFNGLMERLGHPPDIVMQADILALAELKVAAEASRKRLLEGQDPSANNTVRLENMIRRSEIRVGLAPATTSPDQESDTYKYGALFVDDDDDDDAEVSAT
jgi:hypothetical protein